jgi:hypothetical protein
MGEEVEIQENRETQEKDFFDKFNDKIKDYGVIKFFFIIIGYFLIIALISSLFLVILFNFGPFNKIHASLSSPSLKNTGYGIDIETYSFNNIEKYLILSSLLGIFIPIIIYTIYFFLAIRIFISKTTFKEILRENIVYFLIPIFFLIISLSVNMICYLIFSRVSMLTLVFFPFIGQFIFLFKLTKKFQKSYNFQKSTKIKILILPMIILILVLIIEIFICFILPEIIYNATLAYIGFTDLNLRLPIGIYEWVFNNFFGGGYY